MSEFEPVDRDKLFLTLEDHDPVPFYNGKTMGWDLVPGRRASPILPYPAPLPAPDPDFTTLRCYWKTSDQGYIASPLVFGRIEVFTRDLYVFINNPQMLIVDKQVKLRGEYDDETNLQINLTADGSVLIEVAEPFFDPSEHKLVD